MVVVGLLEGGEAGAGMEEELLAAGEAFAIAVMEVLNVVDGEGVPIGAPAGGELVEEGGEYSAKAGDDDATGEEEEPDDELLLLPPPDLANSAAKHWVKRGWSFHPAVAFPSGVSDRT